MPGWSFAERGRSWPSRCPSATAQVQGDRRISWSGLRPPRQRRRPGLPRRGRRGAGQGRPVPLQRPRVPRVPLRAPSRPGWRPDQHELPVPRRRARLPLGQRRRGRGGVPRHLQPIASRASAMRPRVKLWLWVDDGSGPCPEWGSRLRGAAEAGTDAVKGAWARRRPPAPALHRRHDRDAQGRDVAAGRPLPTLVGTFIPTVRHRARPHHRALPKPGPGSARRLPAHARHRCSRSSIVISSGGGTVTLETRNLDVDELLSTIERGVGELDRHRGRRLRQADAPRPRRGRRGVRPVEPQMVISSSGVMFSEARRQALLAHTPG